MLIMFTLESGRTVATRDGKRTLLPTFRAAQYIVWEFWGQGDPYFGGDADDRPLGIDGRFVRGATAARFDALDAAVDAALSADHRASSLVSVLCAE